MAALVTRLRKANVAEITRCLDLFDSIVEASLATPGRGPIDCSKCLMEVLLFAAKIADERFPHRADSYLLLAKSLVPPRPILWTFADVREEVDWYV